MIEAVFVGGPLDGQVRTMDRLQPGFHALSRRYVPTPYELYGLSPTHLPDSHIERYRPERIRCGHDFVFYIHESICIVEAMKKILDWYGQKTQTEARGIFSERRHAFAAREEPFQ